jgi:hypothetical protein
MGIPQFWSTGILFFFFNLYGIFYQHVLYKERLRNRSRSCSAFVSPLRFFRPSRSPAVPYIKRRNRGCPDRTRTSSF